MTSSVGVMVAPNGARLTTSDHPALPVTEIDTVNTVVDCVEAGACAVHLHVRDHEQKHLLDVERYRAATAALQARLSDDFPIQVTTEAVGIYNQAQQIDLVRALKPQFASVALAEIAESEETLDLAESFYHWADREHVALQHIMYTPDDLTRFVELKARGVVPADQWSVIFVLGRYTKNQQSDPAALQLFLDILDQHQVTDRARWMVCAFGQQETECLALAARSGGHARVGFENNRQHADGSIAPTNASRVQALVAKLHTQQQAPCDRPTMRKLLGER